MPTVEEYERQLASLTQQYEEQIKRLNDEHTRAVRTAEQTVKNVKPSRPESVWITGEDGERYLLLNEDAVAVFSEMLDKTEQITAEMENVTRRNN